MRAFVVTVAPDEAELVSDVLFGLGVLAVEERTGEEGTTELWTHVGHDEQAIAAVTAALAERWPVRTVEVDDAVTETWREFATPCEIAPGLVVVPAWIEPPPYGSEVLVVPIDPGAAFGLGDHPTTVLTLRALWQLAEADPDRRGLVGRPLLDVGSGSGVLAVTAALLGADPVEALSLIHI